jgi:hypothetical protein
VLSGNGDPNNVRRARKGSLYLRRDSSPPEVWQNTDGAFTWELCCPSSPVVTGSYIGDGGFMFVVTGFSPKRVEIESEDVNFVEQEIWGRKTDQMPGDYTFRLFGPIGGPATIGTTSGANGVTMIPTGFAVSGDWNLPGRLYFFTATR